MLGQVIAFAAALGLTFLLLQLRRLLGGSKPDSRHLYRAYRANFDEDNDLKIWPSELEIRPTTLGVQQRGLIDGQPTPASRATPAGRHRNEH